MGGIHVTRFRKRLEAQQFVTASGGFSQIPGRKAVDRGGTSEVRGRVNGARFFRVECLVLAKTYLETSWYW